MNAQHEIRGDSGGLFLSDPVSMDFMSHHHAQFIFFYVATSLKGRIEMYLALFGMRVLMIFATIRNHKRKLLALVPYVVPAGPSVRSLCPSNFLHHDNPISKY